MMRANAKSGPMLLVQCDGFACYANAGPQKPPEPARRRLAPAARSSASPIKRSAAAAPPRRATTRPSGAWVLVLNAVIAAVVLMGLFGAYSLGRSAASNGAKSGLAYARPAGTQPPGGASRAETPGERLALHPYLR